MSNLHLVTGYAGVEHVTSNDCGSFNAAMFGNGEFVLERGNQFAANIQSNNKVRVLDGDLLMQGRHIRLQENTYTDLYFDNGTQGFKRVDLIVVRYSKDSESGIEQANLVVIKGTPNENDYNVPDKITGNILNDGALENDTVLYKVKFDGLSIQPLEKVFKTIPSIETFQQELLANIGNTIYPVGAIYLSTTDTSPASLFGGTWERIKDCFLLAAGDTYAAGSTGGEAQHTLTVNEMPAHDHKIWTRYGSGDASAWAYVGTSGKTTAQYPSDGVRRVSVAGVGNSHNNMPPYLAVYIWKRIA